MRIAPTAILALCCAPTLLAAAPPPPVETYTAFPKYDSVVISPHGTHLAFTQRDGSKHLLTIVDFPSMKPNRSFSFGERTDVEDVRWADETRLLIQPSRFITGLRDYKIPTGEIIRADLDTGKVTPLYNIILSQLKDGGSLATKRVDITTPAQILSTHTGDPNQVLIQTVGLSHEKIPASVYMMHIESGRLVGVGSSPVDAGRFVTGEANRVAVAYGVNDQNDTVVDYMPPQSRGPDGHNWMRQITLSREAGDFSPVAWTGRGEEYYALDSRAAATLGIVVWDAAANTQRLLFRSPDFDMRPAALDPAGRLWLFVGTDHYPVYWYPDPGHPLARMHSALVQQFPRHLVDVVSTTDDMSTAVVMVSSGERAPIYLIVDVRAVKPLQLIPTYPALLPPEMAKVDAIEFAARDGLKIWGYVTRPKSRTGKLPLVVLVHGGPFGISDNYGFEFERQLLASRGYAVLQVNFRGSGGRGPRFERSGYGEWGGKMQDDITDGVRWAIQNGVADGERICIYGGSYGAYAALTAVFQEPALYKCAVGLSGVYDLPLMYDRGDIPMMARGVNYLKDVLGQDSSALRARSPVYNAPAIRAKVLLLHGADDMRAPLAHAERMRKALIDAGNPPEWVFETGEAHGFFSPTHRVEAYSQILKFLDQNLSP